MIDEDICIGCTKCIQACPVDAIVGAGKRMHTVIAAECTGCELCVPPCPVDCIAIVPIAQAPLARADVLARATQARRRFDARNERLADARSSRANRHASAVQREESPAPAAPPPIGRSAVLAAIARGKARRSASKEPHS